MGGQVEPELNSCLTGSAVDSRRLEGGTTRNDLRPSLKTGRSEVAYTR